MDLKKAKLGEKYKFYVDGFGAIANTSTLFVKAATIIGKFKTSDIIIIGWKVGDDMPLCGIHQRNIQQLNRNMVDYVSDIVDYVYGMDVSENHIVHDKVEPISKPKAPIKISAINGLNCKRCNEYYQYAEGNQADGTLICYTCRQRGY